MLEPLLQSEIKEKILLCLYANGESYAREISRIFNFNLSIFMLMENHMPGKFLEYLILI
jgi:hypothetical protein